MYNSNIADMKRLKCVCSGLPVDDLPQKKPRNENISHAPVRNHGLSSKEKQVISV